MKRAHAPARGLIMKKSGIARLAAITAGLMLTAFGTLNSEVATRPARAFVVDMVTSTADSGPGSLRDVVGSAAPGDTIMFNIALPATISLTSGEIQIMSSITIAGPGANALTISGSNLSRVFLTGVSSTSVTISGLTIANGNGLSGGGIFN